MNKAYYILLLGFFSLFFVSACSKNDTVFSAYNELPPQGWHKDSIAVFEVTLNEEANYTVFVNVRNSANFKTQNLWLFIDYEQPDKTIKKDTVEFYLADNGGRWLGSGFGSLYEMKVAFLPKINFSQKGSYQFQVKQAMRDTVLVGINDIGLEIVKAH